MGFGQVLHRGMIRRFATHPFGAALKGVQICGANLVNRGFKLTPTNLRQIKNPRTIVRGVFYLVEPSGIEPLTSTLPVLRSPS